MSLGDVLFGAAFGDVFALGWEFSWPPPRAKWLTDATQLKPVEKNGYYCYSDDTEMTLILAEHLVLHNGLDQDSFARELAEKAQLDNPCRYYGSTTTSVLAAVRSGAVWRNASKKVNSYGNGAAIRVSPIPMFYDSEEDVLVFAENQAEVTHSHRLGIQGAQIIALAIYLSSRGVDPFELPYKIIQAYSWDEVYVKKLEKIESLLGESPYRVYFELGNDARAQYSVPTAVYCHVRSQGDVVQSVLCSISVGGDTDSIASMAAAISAAYGGLEVPEDMLVKIENYDRIQDLSSRLYSMRHG